MTEDHQTPLAPDETNGHYFNFMDIVAIIKYTGYNAATLSGLRDAIDSVSDESIFHHTCRYFLKGNVQEHTNEFAQWVSENLQERALAEQLSNIDPYSFQDTGLLRQHLVETIDGYISDNPETRPARVGDEFFFSEAAVYVFPSGTRVKNLAEFLMAIKYIDASSIYYHFYEARARLGMGQDDFSMWVGEMGFADAGAKLRLIDPFMNNMEEIRQEIIAILEKCIQQEMGGAFC